MIATTRTKLRQVCGAAIFAIAAGCLLLVALLMAGCAAGSTSEITPAESTATEKSLRFTPESSRRTTTRIKVMTPSVDVDGEDK